MKTLNLQSQIERQHCMKKRISPVTHIAGLVLALICFTNGHALPGYCLNQQVSSQSAIPQAANSAWKNTGNLNTARIDHTATLLPNGKVLVAGGDGGFEFPTVNSVELYDPATGIWSYTGSLNTARESHTATLLPNGKVLVAGGWSDPQNGINLAGAVNSAEIFDPDNGTWSTTANLNTVRSGHRSILLQNDKVLVVGGFDKELPSKSAELYDPATGTWSVTGSLIAALYLRTATLLENGKVLVVLVGSNDGHVAPTLASAELYDPATGAWSVTANLNAARYVNGATLLPDGKVLVTGENNSLNGAELAELYDPGTETWSFTGSLNAARYADTATLLPTGTVLAAGGYGWNRGLSQNTAELYRSASGIWDSTTNLTTPRGEHTATLLSNGEVLVVGGLLFAGDPCRCGNILNSAELYDPTATIAIPRIVSASVQGKKLFVFGENFDLGAMILLNGEEQKTKPDGQNPETTLIGKKLRKKTKPGDKLQVRNPNGTLSQEFIFPT